MYVFNLLCKHVHALHTYIVYRTWNYILLLEKAAKKKRMISQKNCFYDPVCKLNVDVRICNLFGK